MQTVTIFQHLGDFASRVSTHINPVKVEFEISNRKIFLIRNKKKTARACIDKNNEIDFIYNQFKISEINKRLKLHKRFVDPMKSSTLPKGRLVKIRRCAQLSVQILFTQAQTRECR